MSNEEAVEALKPHLATKMRLFINDRALLGMLTRFLETLGFTNLEIIQVPPNYLTAVQQLYPLLVKEEEIVFVNPPTFMQAGKSKVDKSVVDFFIEMKRFITSKSNKDPMKVLAPCIPIYTEAAHMQMRENTLLQLAEMGITSAFILKEQDPLFGMSAMRQKEMKNEQTLERFDEIKNYLLEYFSADRDRAVEKLRERLSEKELSKKKAEADEWMQKAEELKKTRNYDEAINCYKKAIDIYPDDPDAYLESGRAYVRIQKYGRALERFKEAQEVSEELPTPNEEIGNLRVLQVKEKIDQGADPDSDEVKQLLNDAVTNFEQAFGKAANIKTINKDSTEDKARDAVSKISGAVFKLDLGTMLGHGNEAAKKLGNLARNALRESTEGENVVISTQQKITFALGSTDAGDYQEAEKLLFEAAADPDYFHDACRELNYLGTQVRRHRGIKEALLVYNKLLELNPPNRAAVYFNLAVAYQKENHRVESAGAIVRAIYIDPSMPKDLSFYQNPEIFFNIKRVVELFRAANNFAPKVSVPPAIKKYYMVSEKLEDLYDAGDKQALFRFLLQMSQKMPSFFQKHDTYTNEKVMNAVNLANTFFANVTNPAVHQFKKFIKAVLDNKQKLNIPPAFAECAKMQAQAMHILITTADQGAASANLAKALMLFPKTLQRPDFYANETLVNLAKEVHRKLSAVNESKLG